MIGSDVRRGAHGRGWEEVSRGIGCVVDESGMERG